MAEAQDQTVRRSVNLGNVETSASVTSSGKIRVRHLYTVEQLEMLLNVARESHANEPAELRARATTTDPGKRVFVKEGTPAWSAWLAYKRQNNRIWDLARPCVIDGKTYTGWWFPSLFPPAEGKDDAATA